LNEKSKGIESMLLIFLSSGLFMGWSLGANDAANVFGTAVSTKMIRFRTAALICGIFVIIGAVWSGAGAAHTLGELGSVNAIAGCFIVTLAAAVTVLWMTKLGLPVSTSQAVVGAIIGWNLFSGSPTDTNAISKIISTWILCPLLAAFFAIILFILVRWGLKKLEIHLLRLDVYTRVGLIVAGAFGAYSLGANNIANVMGVFVPVSPFTDLELFGIIKVSSTQQLFLLGAVAIAVGAYTYSRKVMETVGGSLLKLSPETALVVVLAESLVLFLFSSEGLESFLIQHGLPSLPLVPVSSSQAVVGAVIGIGLVKGVKGIKFGVMGEISAGWVSTPLISAVLSFVCLFILQNVFNQEVSRRNIFQISEVVLEQLQREGINDDGLLQLKDKEFRNSTRFQTLLKQKTELNNEQRRTVFEISTQDYYYINETILAQSLDRSWYTPGQVASLNSITGRSYSYKWQMWNDLEQLSDEWKLKPAFPENRLYNKDLKAKRELVNRIFQIENPATEE
jgi:inorganic phosphate transporter, PiT family